MFARLEIAGSKADVVYIMPRYLPENMNYDSKKVEVYLLHNRERKREIAQLL